MKKLVKALLGKRIYEAITRSVITRSIVKVVDETHANKNGYTAQTAINLIFSSRAKYLRPWQHMSEILELAKLIDERKPETILEIGTARGGTLLLSALLADPEALILSIDLQYGMYGGGYPDWKIPLYKSFRQYNQQIELIQGDSHSAAVREQLERALDGRKIDYLFIDGDHTYDGVKQDFEMYKQFLSDDAFVAFHDIVSDKAPVPDHFVSVYWNDIKNSYPHKEFIQDPAQSKSGLGVLMVRK